MYPTTNQQPINFATGLNLQQPAVPPTPTINSTALTPSPTPAYTPAVQVPVPPLPIPEAPTVAPGTGTATGAAPTPTTPVAPTPQASDLQTRLDALYGQLTGKEAATATAVDTATASDNRQLNELNKAIRLQSANAIARQEAALRSGETTGFASREAQNVQRTDAIESMRLSALAEAVQGNISLATTHATNAVNAQFAQTEKDLQVARQNIIANYDSFTPAEKKRADATLLQINEKDAFVQQQKADKEAISKLAITAAQNGADNVTLDKISKAKTVDEATAFASSALGAKFNADQKQQTFDNNIKTSQLAIEQAKLNLDRQKAKNDAVTNADPSQILAYAQQYASDGKIPTGLPKGTFGIVSQVAKELPKVPGTLVDRNTGIKPSSLSPTQEDGIIAGRDLLNKLDDLKVDLGQLHTGILPGIKNAVLPSEASQRFNDMRKEIIDLLARARTGAVINASEEANYAAKLPTNFSKPLFLGKSPTIQIDDLKRSLEGKLQTQLKTQGVAIYGYSTVKLGSYDYTVGQIVTNPDGKQGRVNPDGTITLIQ